MAAGVKSPTKRFYVTLNEPGEGSEISLQKLKDNGYIPKRWHQFEIIDIKPEENMLVLETKSYDFSTSKISIRLDIGMEIEEMLDSIPSGINRPNVRGFEFDYGALREWKLPTKSEIVKDIVEGESGDGQTGGRKKSKSKRKSSRRTRKFSKKSSQSKKNRRIH